MAREVNQVFNFCNETSARAIRGRHQFLSEFDDQQPSYGILLNGVFDSMKL